MPDPEAELERPKTDQLRNPALNVCLVINIFKKYLYIYKFYFFES